LTSPLKNNYIIAVKPAMLIPNIEIDHIEFMIREYLCAHHVLDFHLFFLGLLRSLIILIPSQQGSQV